MVLAGHSVALPEIVDYELRREMLRLRNEISVAKLDQLVGALAYLPITTSTMRQAAELWALARQRGQPTAADKALDCDMILIAQAMVHGASQGEETVIATTNVSHLNRFTAARLWSDMS